MRLNFKKGVPMWLVERMEKLFMYIAQRFCNCISNIYLRVFVVA